MCLTPRLYNGTGASLTIELSDFVVSIAAAMPGCRLGSAALMELEERSGPIRDFRALAALGAHPLIFSIESAADECGLTSGKYARQGGRRLGGARSLRSHILAGHRTGAIGPVPRQTNAS